MNRTRDNFRMIPQRAAIVPLLLALLLAMTGRASAWDKVRVIDDQLQTHEGTLVSLTDRQLRLFDDQRQATSLEGPRVARVIWLGAVATGGRQVMAHLADGQVVAGKLAEATDAGMLSFEVDDLGVIKVNLEQVSRISFPVTTPAPAAASAKPPATGNKIAAQETPANPASSKTEPPRPSSASAAGAAPAAGDVVHLANGDRLTGFVEALNTTQLHLQTGKQTVKIDLDRVAMIELANPVRELPGIYLQLSSGARIRVTELNLDAEGGGTGVTFAKAAFALKKSKAVQVDFHQQHRLMNLADLPRQVIAGGKIFGVEHPVTTSQGVIGLHAPIQVRFTLPEGAARFSASAMIAEEARAAGDMKIFLLDEKGELAAEHLHPGKTTATLAAPLRSRELTLKLDDAAGGPVLDRLELHEARILIKIGK